MPDNPTKLCHPGECRDCETRRAEATERLLDEHAHLLDAVVVTSASPVSFADFEPMRHTADTITDAALDALYEELAKARATLDRVRTFHGEMQARALPRSELDMMARRLGDVFKEPAAEEQSGPAEQCGFRHDQWDGPYRMPRRCIAAAGHTKGQFAYDHGPWASVKEAEADRG
jgi:hypothetical protein